MSVKGHTLVWHSQLPDWVASITNADQLRLALINHVFQEVLHYRGQVVAWDVVNEAVADTGQSLRSSVFYQVLGDSYIDDAFNAAHAADPDARLYYNDYGADGLGAKSDYVYRLVQGMLARGVPIHGVGLQMHTVPADAPSAVDIAANMQRLAALGLDVAITEMDVPTCTGDLDAQGRRFHDIVAACVAQPACKAITVWGLTDKYSWRNGTGCSAPRPLLFDDNYVAKLYPGARPGRAAGAGRQRRARAGRQPRELRPPTRRPGRDSSRALLQLFFEDQRLVLDAGVAEHHAAMARPGAHEAVQTLRRDAFTDEGGQAPLDDRLAELRQPVLVGLGRPRPRVPRRPRRARAGGAARRRAARARRRPCAAGGGSWPPSAEILTGFLERTGTSSRSIAVPPVAIASVRTLASWTSKGSIARPTPGCSRTRARWRRARTPTTPSPRRTRSRGAASATSRAAPSSAG